MTAAQSSIDVVTRSDAAPSRRRPLQVGLLGAGLVTLAIVMYLAAAPGGAARRPVPASTSGEAPAVARSLPSPPAREHLVLLVSNPELGATLRRRIFAGEVIGGEFGALGAPLSIEVVVAADAAALETLARGLREYEAQCIAEPCPTIRVLDLRLPAGAE